MQRFLFIFLFFTLLASGCGKDLITGKHTLNYYSLGSDIQLGEMVLQTQSKALTQKNKKLDEEIPNPEELQRIRRIVQEIVPHTHIPNFPYEVHLADVDIVNAWCAPGGKIMVYTGLWDPKKGLVEKGNDDELAAVLSHEIAHATARHVTESISQISTVQLVGEVAASIIAKAGAPANSDAFKEIFYQGLNVYVPSYSRKNESEADSVGLFYMAKAGYNPEAAIRLWERAAREKKGDETSIYASHPSSGERARRLKAMLPQAMEVYQAALKSKKRG